VVRLIGGSLLPQAHRMAAAGARFLYGVYGWLLFAVIAPPTWLLTALAPSPAAAWRANRRAARTVLRLAGIGLAVRGLEHLPRTPCVLVANHASYLDGLALVAAIPADFSFVAKRELLDHPVARLYLRGLGVQFVERFAARQSVEDARRLAEPVKTGTSAALFPEGTFRRMPGLGTFHLGAFAAAAVQVPVLPVAIRGTRRDAPAGQWLPRRGAIAVTIGSPVFPPSSGVGRIRRRRGLRDSARAHPGALRRAGCRVGLSKAAAAASQRGGAIDEATIHITAKIQRVDSRCGGRLCARGLHHPRGAGGVG
jgi:1-acyl-sn-glycerol-3-phosphate acyltransferase